MRSLRMRCSESTHSYNVKNVAAMHESTVDADIINMMTICSLAACSTSTPPRIAPVIVPGIEMIPITLSFNYNKPGWDWLKREPSLRTSFG